MYPKPLRQVLLLGANLAVAKAIALPEPTAAPAKVEARAPIITPAARRFDATHSYGYDRRNVIDDIKSGAGNVLHSLGSVLGQDLPSYVISGKLHISYDCVGMKLTHLRRAPFLPRFPDR